MFAWIDQNGTHYTSANLFLDLSHFQHFNIFHTFLNSTREIDPFTSIASLSLPKSTRKGEHTPVEAKKLMLLWNFFQESITIIAAVIVLLIMSHPWLWYFIFVCKNSRIIQL